MIIYKQDILKLLKTKGYKQYKLIQDGLLSSSTLKLLRANKMISITALDRICQLCQCDISDLVQYEDIDFLNDYTRQDKKKF